MYMWVTSPQLNSFSYPYLVTPGPDNLPTKVRVEAAAWWTYLLISHLWLVLSIWETASEGCSSSAFYHSRHPLGPLVEFIWCAEQIYDFGLGFSDPTKYWLYISWNRGTSHWHASLKVWKNHKFFLSMFSSSHIFFFFIPSPLLLQNLSAPSQTPFKMAFPDQQQ